MRNATETALKTNIGFVTSDLYAEIIRKTNIGFVTSDLYATCYRNRTENEHRGMRNTAEIALKTNMVCNLRFICERLQKSHGKRT